MSFTVLVLSPNQAKVWFVGQRANELKTVAQWCNQEKADLAFNLGVFDMQTGASYTFVKGANVNLDAGGETDPKIGGKSNVLVLNAQNKCKGYSNGILNGNIHINAGMGGSRSRNGIGITSDGCYIIAQSTHKVTERAFCDAVNNYVKAKKKTVKLFVLEDGGGSTCEYSVRSKRNIAPEGGRPCATVVCVKFTCAVNISRDLYYGCIGEDVELYQMIVGGLEIDGSYGSISEKVTKQMQAGLGLPKKLQNGNACINTLKKLGYTIT